MSQFDETVAKLASSPAKVRLLSSIPGRLLEKEAAPLSGLMDDVLGGAQKDLLKGRHDVAKSVASNVLGAGILAATGLGFGAVYETIAGNQDAIKAQNTEVGKMNAQSAFKAQMVTQLQPHYDSVYKDIMNDDVIGKADKKMIDSAYETMKRFAPNLAADENAARSFLREHAVYGTGPSYASLKNLAESEQAVARAGGIFPVLNK